VDEPDENFYDYGLANDTIDRLRYVAPLWKNHGKPFFLASGWARPHAPWRVPLRMWNLYNSTDIPLAKHQLPPDNMPGIAWKQDGFYNATNGDVFLPHITKPLDVRVQKLMRRAYYSAVTWMDTQVYTD
jgi:iduronate 2-sulfatase